ncbi:MAG: hypothetical protein PF501_00545 [Salinisphaera sp.]|jgi:hypothetical protein|nr:hypothetical protein [Salinisphaera sp.]
MRVLSHYKHWKQTTYRRRDWNIGFVAFDEQTICKPLQIAWLAHDYSDGWFADPFIVRDDGDRLDVLVEHFVYAEDNGHIARLVVRRAGDRYLLEDMAPVIQDGTHFSFPNIHRSRQGGDRLFIYPENAQSGKLEIYAYDLETGRAERAGLLQDAPLVDAVITQAFGRPRLFATHEERDPSGRTLEIFVSESDDWRGPYASESEHVFSDRVARGAGQFFSMNGRLIRAAQDNNGIYGGGLVFFDTHYDGRRFSFTEIARHVPRDARYNLALHTFNVHGSIAAVDGRGYAHPLRRAEHRLKQRLGKTKRVGSPHASTTVS